MIIDLTIASTYNVEPKTEHWELVRWYTQSKRFYPGCGLYLLTNPFPITVLGFATSCNYVLVSVTPRADDHGFKETTAFAANKNGSFFGGFLDKDAEDKEDWTWVEKLDYESAEFEHSRVVKKYNHKLCLQRLLGLKPPGKKPTLLPHEPNSDPFLFPFLF